ncbi:MAG: hypothetical protein RI988_739 [Pseudomonadota bacterium]|jgi:hypothetical protein
MIVRPLKPDDVSPLVLQPTQRLAQPLLLDPAYRDALCSSGPAYGAWVGDRIVGAGGLLEVWPGRAHAWALIGEGAGRHWLLIHRATLRALESHSFRRVETAVVSDFAAGHRWAEMLGFVREGRMRGYAPDGTDCDLYARVTCKH